LLDIEYCVSYKTTQFQSQNGNLCLYEEKSLVGLAPGVNFINFLRAVFTHADPESKKDSEVVSLFSLSGSAHIKAAHKTL
jgi:hypothetical protein